MSEDEVGIDVHEPPGSVPHMLRVRCAGLQAVKGQKVSADQFRIEMIAGYEFSISIKDEEKFRLLLESDDWPAGLTKPKTDKQKSRRWDIAAKLQFSDGTREGNKLAGKKGRIYASFARQGFDVEAARAQLEEHGIEKLASGKSANQADAEGVDEGEGGDQTAEGFGPLVTAEPEGDQAVVADDPAAPPPLVPSPPAWLFSRATGRPVPGEVVGELRWDDHGHLIWKDPTDGLKQATVPSSPAEDGQVENADPIEPPSSAGLADGFGVDADPGG